MRFGLNKDLGFSERDRNENIRRIAEVRTLAGTTEVLCSLGLNWKLTRHLKVAKLFADSSTITLTSFISPYQADRKIARDLHAASAPGSTDEALPFIEVFVDVPLEVAEQRDPKGLYKKARAGEIKEFTGISAPYEAPENPEIHIKSEQTSVEDAVRQIVAYLEEKGLLKV